MSGLQRLSVRTINEAIGIRRRNKIASYYPDTGPLRRELYPKHSAYFAAGEQERERLFLAANRVGKTEGVGAYEMSRHLTGNYPAWWQGRRFSRPVTAWAAGDTSKTVREILQEKLLGPIADMGTGMIPADSIVYTARKAGVPEAIEIVYVRHKSGKNSTLTLKSYDQRREGFQGSDIDVIWLDEECPMDIYTECLIRTMTTNGLVMLTFTPLQGLTEVVLSFLPGGQLSGEGKKFVVQATWDDAPHLSEQVKRELWGSIPPYQRDARSKGIPQLGSGAIYPLPESDIVISDFKIRAHYPRVYGMDVGWNRTAAIWGAKDLESGIVYLYAEHYRGRAEPSVHVEGIKSRGVWIPGVIDPSARGRAQKDGVSLMSCYRDLGLNLETAINTREAGIYRVWQMLSSGKLKIFESCRKWREEFRMYRRDEDGKIVKENDHLMDAMRYLVMSGLSRAKTEPVKATVNRQRPTQRGWMGA